MTNNDLQLPPGARFNPLYDRPCGWEWMSSIQRAVWLVKRLPADEQEGFIKFLTELTE